MFELAVIGMGLSALGVGTSFFGSLMGNDANQDLVSAQQKAEKLRYQQMQADAERKRRQAIRQGIIQQHQAVSNTVLQGAGESSGAYGAAGQVNQEVGWNVAGVNIAEHFGKGIYEANQQALAAKGEIANAETIKSFGSGLSSLGGAMLGNMGTINSLFAGNPMPIASSTAYQNLSD